MYTHMYTQTHIYAHEEKEKHIYAHTYIYTNTQ